MTNTKTILVTGGAGYIGSHTVRVLLQQGYSVIVLDNLSTGHRDSIPEDNPLIHFIQGNLEDPATLNKIFQKNEIDTVMHFAGSIEAGESMQNPAKYFSNNTVNTLRLLEAMKAHNVKKIIFSSTAAVYGEPQYTPIDEQHQKQPTNYYGLSKLMIEQILEAFDHAYGVKSVSLRYFNAAGADEHGLLGEDHNPETHLIPLLIKTVFHANQSRGSQNNSSKNFAENKKFSIFGTDYPTKDGTCIRDFIHVMDLAEAHVLALKYLQQGGKSEQFNVGSETGYSVKEIIRSVEEITGEKIPLQEEPRRAGDPAVLIASSKKIKTMLVWHPQQDLHQILRSALQWHRKRHG